MSISAPVEARPKHDRRALERPLTYRLFATREGLVGGTTASGHQIVERDHFVALPSPKTLPRKGNFTVRVCRTDGRRCEYAPVWDVGPWNEHDDYWNPAGVRAQFGSLPQGVPEAQAAYENGFNGGKDERGRTVRNPAGLDLADGTFWDGLGLTGSSYVDVAFLWTGTAPDTAVVTTAGAPLVLRTGTGTTAPEAGFAANGAQVPVECTAEGEAVDGTTAWDRIGPGHYVSEAYLRRSRAAVPVC
ncbi:hypothetical protein [Amycolatopsis benzoatilytica]|uniref:hypothetical protein n=1 Tax=Amycolatopsis benzoatilytica TaxID=346045 RepID=UPI001B7FD342